MLSIIIFVDNLRHQVDQVPRNAVVFISQPTPHINACYGGLMSEGLKFLGAAGVVIDGAFRDLQEHRDLGLPVSLTDISKLIHSSMTDRLQ